MSLKGNLDKDKKLTNTSARKHLCQTLLENNISNQQIVFWTGRKKAQSLNNYRIMTSLNEVFVIFSGTAHTDAAVYANSTTRSNSNMCQSGYVTHSSFKSIFDVANTNGVSEF